MAAPREACGALQELNCPPFPCYRNNHIPRPSQASWEGEAQWSAGLLSCRHPAQLQEEPLCRAFGNQCAPLPLPVSPLPHRLHFLPLASSPEPAGWALPARTKPCPWQAPPTAETAAGMYLTLVHLRPHQPWETGSCLYETISEIRRQLSP